MKLLVTGGAGFIGSAVVRLAMRRGHSVINVDSLTYAACLDNVAEVADMPGYTFVHADICDRAAMDPTRIREELGWRPSVTVEEGLELTVRWYLQNEEWWRALQTRDGVGQRLGRATA